MQINLIPKTREQEQRRNQINSIIIMVSVSFLVATAIIAAVFFSINASKKNEIKKNDKKISELRADIEKYKDVEGYINNLVEKSSDAYSIISTRRDLNVALLNLQALLPRELSLNEFNLNSNTVRFKIKATSYSKIAEAIKSLEEYEAVVPSNNLSDVNKSSEDKKEDNEKSQNKTKMFTSVDPSNFNKYEDNNRIYYGCEIVATLSEALWLSE